MNTILRLARITALVAISGYFALSFAGSGPASPRTYYISSSAGNDSNDGLSPARPWQHLGMVSLKASSKDPFQPGDNILLKRGDAWYGQIRVQANGTAERTVNMGSYGDGAKPVIYGDGEQLRWQPVAGHKGVFSALVGEGSTIGVVYQGGKPLKLVNPAGALTRPEEVEAFLANLQPGTAGPVSGDQIWVHTIGDQPAGGTVRLFRVAAISIFNSSYVHVENLDIQRFYTGIDVTTSHDVLIDHNDVQDILGIGVYLRSGDRSCQVESNTVYHSGNTALYVLEGSDNTFRDNWISHTEAAVVGIPLGGDKMGIGLQQSQRSLVEYNYFAYGGGIDFYFEQGSTVRYNYLYRVTSAGAPHGVNLQLYGNIYNLAGEGGKPGSTGINAVATGPGTIEVFNNTIADASGYFLMGSSEHGGRVVFSDNIAFSSSGGLMTLFGANATSDHNCYFSPRQVTFQSTGVTFHSLQDYQRQTGMDRDSMFGDPQFAGQASLTPLDFRISESSPCNSKSSRARLVNVAASRTYDHQGNSNGETPIGAMQAHPGAVVLASGSCKANCFGRSFAVPRGTYLVRLQLVSSTFSTRATPEFNLSINGRKFTAAAANAKASAGSGTLDFDFLVRPDDRGIRVDLESMSSAMTNAGIEILPFDSAHGEGPLAIPW